MLREQSRNACLMLPALAAQALEELRKKPSGWWGVVLSPLVTQTREYHTIHNLSKMPVGFPSETPSPRRVLMIVLSVCPDGLLCRLQ